MDKGSSLLKIPLLQLINKLVNTYFARSQRHMKYIFEHIQKTGRVSNHVQNMGTVQSPDKTVSKTLWYLWAYFFRQSNLLTLYFSIINGLAKLTTEVLTHKKPATWILMVRKSIKAKLSEFMSYFDLIAKNWINMNVFSLERLSVIKTNCTSIEASKLKLFRNISVKVLSIINRFKKNI